MQSAMFEYVTADGEAGFRLHELQAYNWGTFNKHIWTLSPQGHNALLTGDIGSGKSTLVDALTTLLVPHHRITYNKAAGAEGKERTLYSYVRGEYKNEQDDATQLVKAVGLRDESHYSVLLAYFHNQGYAKGFTLAQVFWLKEGQRNPERFFIVAAGKLTIDKHFANFGTEMVMLKKRLKQQAHIEVFESFKDYATCFRRHFGIQNEQALDLFYQTVSMKSVGNLTEFVRLHMLEKTNVEERIRELCSNFENLNRAHESVLKARTQIELLKPILEQSREYQTLQQENADSRLMRAVISPYFAALKLDLIKKRLASLALDQQKEEGRLVTTSAKIAQLRETEKNLRMSIHQNGGERLEQLVAEITRLSVERERKSGRATLYQNMAGQLKLPMPKDSDGFYQNRQQLEILRQEQEGQRETLNLQQIDHRLLLKKLQDEEQNLQTELTSLKKRKSNIPFKMLELRANMLEALKVSEQDLPFAGELIQIDEREEAWFGAIERLLHNFGLSILVPESLYDPVSRYVERTDLKERIVYFRVKMDEYLRNAATLRRENVVNKLQVKPESVFYDWLIHELNHRFDYICAETLIDFQREPKAMTRNGQIKAGGQRHEKDDRHAINDRSRYILGWSNAAKIRALTEKLKAIQAQGQAEVKRLLNLDQQLRALVTARDLCRDLVNILDFEDINWVAVAKTIEICRKEQKEIEANSNILSTLREQLAVTENLIIEHEQKAAQHHAELGGLIRQIKDCETLQQNNEDLLAKLDALLRERFFPRLSAFRLEKLGDKKLALDHIEKTESELRGILQAQIDAVDKKLSRLEPDILQEMHQFKTAYPLETAEMDAHLDATVEYQQLLNALESEDLPRHEARFKRLLNEGTINSIALLQNQLDKERGDIQEKIARINTSLQDIEYNAGTYVTLVMDQNQDVEIRGFRQDLIACLSGTLDQNELYTESKFLEVKALISKFVGREGQTENDRRWMQKVTDVRNWFNFSASERFFHDHAEKEHYSDTAGKSGGQKEKLAYTVLASALAYQFSLEWGATKSQSFRFVVIDEAFGRGSDESTRYGLTLFKKLNLQLLIVTPLQKIHVIENYIRAIHFVHNVEGRDSRVRNLTIEEYRAEKEKFVQGQ